MHIYRVYLQIITDIQLMFFPTDLSMMYAYYSLLSAMSSSQFQNFNTSFSPINFDTTFQTSQNISVYNNSHPREIGLEAHKEAQVQEQNVQQENVQDQKSSPQVMKQKEIQKQDQVQFKYNRPILPNEMHCILYYVEKRKRSGIICEKIFNHHNHNSQWSVARYYNYQKNIKSKMNYYMNERTIGILSTIYAPQSDIYSIEEQQFYMKVARILAHYYLTYEVVPSVFNSKRMRNHIKKQHLINRRGLLKNFSKLLRNL